MNNNVPMKNYLLLAMPFLIIVVITGLNFKPIWDEGAHVKLIDQYKDSFPEFDLKMSHANVTTTPLFHMILSFFAWIVGSELWKLRLMNLLIGFFTVLIFYRISRNMRNQYPFLNTVMFLFFPYYLLLSSSVMTDILALFFGLLALMFYIKDNTTKNILFGSIFSTLAVSTRQFWLFLPAGMILYYILKYKTNHTELRNISLIFIPIIAFLSIVLYWGGMTPPVVQGRYYISTTFNQINQIGYFILFLGFYFFPYAVISRSPKSKFQFIYLTLPIIFPLILSIANECNGMMCQVLNFSNYLYPFLLFILLFIGLKIIITYLSKNEYNLKLMSFILAYMGIVLFTPVISERYMMVFVPLLILALFNKIERRTWVYYMWILTMILFSIIYFIAKIHQ